MRSLALALLAATLVAAPAASGAFTVATGAIAKPALRVAADGTAEVSWTDQGGARRTVLVPERGRVRPGVRIEGNDVSRVAAVAGLPFLRAARRTADGTLYALQLWATQPGGARELRFARWSGDPPEVELEAEADEAGTVFVIASGVFRDKPLLGSSPTPEGKRIAIRILFECRGCPIAKGGFARMLGAAPKAPSGDARVRLREAWLGTHVRAILPGPNLGVQYTPDTLAVVPLPA
jgi:hypothetical protein